MNILCNKRTLIVCAYLAPVVCGLSGFAVPAAAQDVVLPTASRSYPTVIPATSGASVLTDGEVAIRVKGALHAAPYLYDEHVAVSVEHGAVVLRGIVFSDSDLVDAIRIANKAAGDRRVVDDLSIDRNGRR